MGIGPKGGESQIFNEDMSVRKSLPKFVGLSRQELIAQNQAEIDRRNAEIAANEEIANDDNEQPEVRERPLEKVEEEIQNVVALEEQNEKLREKLLLRERVKEIFKGCGLTLTTVILALELRSAL